MGPEDAGTEARATAVCVRTGGAPAGWVGTMESGAADAIRDCGSLAVLLGGRTRSARALAGAGAVGCDCTGLIMTV
jgi:hypothetical protein